MYTNARRLGTLVGVLLALLSGVALGATSSSDDESFSYALIVGVAVYRDNDVPPLFGVPDDMDSAKEIALAMGVPQDHITELFNRDSTKDGITSAIRALAAKAKNGGRVLIYFSGHGTRRFDPSARGCVEGLLTWDRKVIVNREFAALVRPIGASADKLVVMLDACHSGGVATLTRAMASGEPLRPKFFDSKSGRDGNCSEASNVRTRSLMDSLLRGPNPLPENVIHIAAARADEVAFDEPGKGGLGTQAVKYCMLEGAEDLDGSGAVTLAEVEQCSRSFVAKKLEGRPGLLPHHVTIRGVRNLVAVPRPPAPVANPAQPQIPISVAQAREERERIEQQRQQAAAALRLEQQRLAHDHSATALLVQQPQTAVVTPPAATPEVDDQSSAHAAVTAEASLGDIFEQRDRRIKVSVKPSNTRVKIGQESLRLAVNSSLSGYLYLLILGSDQTAIYVLYPNSLDSQNAIKANQTLRLPGVNWSFRPGGPPGKDVILAVVSKKPLDLSKFGLAGGDGPFSFQPSTPEGRRRFVGTILESLRKAGSYGADRVELEEFE